jgi:hypothetical protein
MREVSPGDLQSRLPKREVMSGNAKAGLSGRLGTTVPAQPMPARTVGGHEHPSPRGLVSRAVRERVGGAAEAAEVRGLRTGSARSPLPSRMEAIVPSAGLAPYRDLLPRQDLARGAAREHHQVEQIRVAREQLLEQKKTNRHLEGRHDTAIAVFEA